ncbi:MAG: 6-bladed beta-propeller [Mediterranea sp.]|jgi:hypothetical protein|nr:6-bladed beta-propeller [Mediterranea sp.]
MKAYILFLLSLALFVCSCSNRDTDRGVTLDVAGVLNNKSVVPIGDIAERVTLVPLETNDSVLISYISNVVPYKEYLAIVHNKRCSFFSKEGKYSHKIERIGNGPEEYLDITNLFVRDDKVYIYDQTKSRITIYSLAGKFAGFIGIPKRVTAVRPMESDMYAGFIANASGREPTKMLLIDKEGTVVDSIPYKESYENTGPLSFFYDTDPYIYPYDGQLCFKEMYGDTIFSVGKELRPVPHYVVRLGGNYLKMEDRYQTITDPRQNPLKGKRYLTKIWESSRYLFLGGVGLDSERSKGTVIYDKRTKTLRYADIQYTPQEEQLFDKKNFVPRFISPDNKLLISTETPVVADDKKEEDNPVVVLLHLLF